MAILGPAQPLLHSSQSKLKRHTPAGRDAAEQLVCLRLLVTSRMSRDLLVLRSMSFVRWCQSEQPTRVCGMSLFLSFAFSCQPLMVPVKDSAGGYKGRYLPPSYSCCLLRVVRASTFLCDHSWHTRNTLIAHASQAIVTQQRHATRKNYRLMLVPDRELPTAFPEYHDTTPVFELQSIGLYHVRFKTVAPGFCAAARSRNSRVKLPQSGLMDVVYAFGLVEILTEFRTMCQCSHSFSRPPRDNRY